MKTNLQKTAAKATHILIVPHAASGKDKEILTIEQTFKRYPLLKEEFEQYGYVIPQSRSFPELYPVEVVIVNGMRYKSINAAINSHPSLKSITAMAGTASYVLPLSALDKFRQELIDRELEAFRVEAADLAKRRSDFDTFIWEVDKDLSTRSK